ncbi:MAG TPA: cytochrome c peroxidase [Pseudaminobacter sp.]|nr:cytochrome c peroxidase [Pseudaminobacter sp.]
MRSRATFALGLVAALTLGGCGEPDFTEAEKAMIASLSLSALPPLPPDPTNRYADLPAAAAFGATLFFEQRLSRDGNVSCATCHLIDRQFQDDRPLAVGVATTNRRTMPLAGVARSPWFFWDGRKDSLWSQALGPLEDAREHAGNRTAYAHFIGKEFAGRYERIFGPLPDLSGLPKNAGPLGTEAEKAAWNGMSGEQRASIDRVFANLGKAIAAFERSIVHEPTRFDRFADSVAAGREPKGEAAFSDEEIQGLKLFIGKANCVTCHNGPRLTDDHFHNSGVPAVKELPEDRGRETAVAQVAADPFNCLGAFRDGGEEACGELRFMVKSGDTPKRAYKTPSLRGAATRPPYMHSGQIATLEDVVEHYNTAPPSPWGTSEMHPLGLSERERSALIAFLKTLAE